MKYGIDINNEKILSFISEKLKEKGNFIIDFTDKNNKNNGRALLKKVLIANVTNIDFYFAIDFKNDISFAEILYDEHHCSKVFAQELANFLESKFINIICKIDNHLYLIKNIEAPVVYVSFPMSDKEEIEDLLIDNKIIDILLRIKI